MNIYLIVNPFAGMKKGNRILKEVEDIFQKYNIKYKIAKTEYPGHAKKLIKNLNLEDFDKLCVIGGDGTFNEVINGLMLREDKKQIPIGLIPGGSGNSLMHTIGCLDLCKAAHTVIMGKPKYIDAARVMIGEQITYSINIIGWGLVTDIGITAEKYRWMGESRYTLVSLLEIFRLKRNFAKLIINNNVEYEEFTFILALNTQYTGKGMLAAPKAKLDDGLIDLIVVRESGKIKLLKLLPKIFDGSHINSEIVEYQQVNGFSLIPNEDTLLNIDGEIMGKTPIKVTMVPKCFALLM